MKHKQRQPSTSASQSIAVQTNHIYECVQKLIVRETLIVKKINSASEVFLH